jgi:putative phage-type endonuclease
MLSNQELEIRRTVITGTDASIILGVNPYESIIELWQRKLGYLPEKDLSDNASVKAGQYLEPVVKKMFVDLTGKEVNSVPFTVHPKLQWMAGTMDGYINDENAVVEFKTARFDQGWGKQGENIIPKHYLCQVAHYMAVMDAAYAYVAVLIGGWDFRHYVIDRNEKLEELIIKKEEEFFYKNMQQNIMPEARNMGDIVTKYQNETLKEPIVADERIMMLFKELKSIKSHIKECSFAEKEKKDEIALFMKNHETLLSPLGEILLTWKPTKDYVKLDTVALKRENLDTYNAYLRTHPGSRRFLLKGESEE